MNCINKQGVIVFVVIMLLTSISTTAQETTLKNYGENSLSINELMARALLTNPSVNSAQKKLEAAIARGRALGQSLYNPNLDFEYENSEQVTKTIGLSQTIDWNGKRSANQELARVNTEKARLEYKVVRNSLMSSIAKAISNYERTTDLLAIKEKSLISATKLSSFAQRRYSQGDITLKELQTAKLALFRSQTEKNNALSSMLSSKQTLEALTGIAAAQWSLEYLANLELPSLTNVSEYQSPVLLLSQLTYLEKKSEMEVARKQRSVDPTVGVKYGKEGDNNIVGVNFSIPLPIRNNFKDSYIASSKEMKAAEFDFENRKRLFQANLFSNHSRITMLSKSWINWQNDSHQSLESQYELLFKLLENNEINTLNYLLEIDQLLQTEEAIVDMRFNLEIAWIDWFELTDNYKVWAEN